MDKVTMFAGLDYHQDSIQVCVMDHRAKIRMNSSCANNRDEVVKLLRKAGPVGAIALEACCGAADLADQLALAGDWRVELAHSGYVSKLKGSPDKTDYSDARLLADLTRVGYLPRVWLAPQSIRDIRQLVKHRQRLVNQRRDLKLRIGGCLREQRVRIEDAGRWSRKWTEAMANHPKLTKAVRWTIQEMLMQMEVVSGWVEKAEERLREATAHESLLGRLRRIEGIGEVTAWMLLAHIGRFDRFTNGKQLARFCGLSPRNVSSGKKEADGGLIDGCSKELRAVLIQAAQRLVRTHGRWKALFGKLVHQGKPRCLAISAVANRWVRTLHHRVLKEESEQDCACEPGVKNQP